MNDIITSSFLAMAGQILLVVLPLVVVVGAGLFFGELIKRQFNAAFAGVAFPALVAIAGASMVAASQASARDFLASSSIMMLLPYSIGFAGLIFVLLVLPGIFRAARLR